MDIPLGEAVGEPVGEPIRLTATASERLQQFLKSLHHPGFRSTQVSALAEFLCDEIDRIDRGEQ